MKRRLQAHLDTITLLPLPLSPTFPSSLTALPPLREVPTCSTVCRPPSRDTQNRDSLYKSAFCPKRKAESRNPQENLRTTASVAEVEWLLHTQNTATTATTATTTITATPTAGITEAHYGIVMLRVGMHGSV
ncbi:hypothetical protein E2C01_023547 [Portunus trituberculatus]|uniref:Uncharacterized protein n=1 Tax=Portunus trituberculatus TaxID=210409 RepID=A0A5B7EAC4_PORTR|nr:hypothetical protein [Portunus trituberculatus]